MSTPLVVKAQPFGVLWLAAAADTGTQVIVTAADNDELERFRLLAALDPDLAPYAIDEVHHGALIAGYMVTSKPVAS